MTRLIAANFTHHPGRTIASVFGVALGVVRVVLTVGLVRGMLLVARRGKTRLTRLVMSERYAIRFI